MATCVRKSNVDSVGSNLKRMFRNSGIPEDATDLLQDRDMEGNLATLRVTSLRQTTATEPL